MFLEGKLDRYKTEGVTSKRWLNAINEAFNEEILKSLGIKYESGINYDRVANCFQNAFERQKMALARTYSIPGPKMVFQGDDRADITPFRFFRQFDSVKHEDYLENEKGYKTGHSAFDASKLGTTQFSYNARNLMNKHKFLMRELNRITATNSALTKGVLIQEDTIKHTNSQVFATHAFDKENDNHIFSVTNFMDASYPRQNSSNYYIKFPKGKWVELINTDDRRFGGSGDYVNSRIIDSNGYDNVPIKLAGQSTSIFRRID
jgi:1,4-alpha-glucan branching enzyme